LLIRFRTLLVALIVLFALGTSAAAVPVSQTVTLNKVSFNFVFADAAYQPPTGQEGVIYQDYTYLPLRFVTEMLGYVVTWDGKTQTVIVNEPSTTEEKQRILDYRKERKVKWEDLVADKAQPSDNTRYTAVIQPIKYLFFGAEKNPGNFVSFNINNSIYVSARFLTESVGSKIQFDPGSRSVIVDQIKSYDLPGENIDDDEELITDLDGAGSDGDHSPGTAPNNGNSSPANGSNNQKPTDPKNPDQTGTTGGGNSNGGDSGTGEQPPADPTTTNPPPGDTGSGGSGNSGDNTGNTGNNNGNTKPKVSYTKIISQHDRQISSLRVSCQDRLIVAYSQYQKATTSEAQSAAIDKGYAILGGCDASFEGIMSSLTSQLQDNGYSTSIVDSYRSQYEQEKQAAINALL